MKHTLSITLLLLFTANVSIAQHKNKHYSKEEKFKMYSSENVLVGKMSIGGIGGYAAVSAGLEYEKQIDKKGYFGCTLGLAAYLGGTIGFGGELENGEVWGKNTGYFIAPGFRFHPLQKGHKADIGLGISTPLGYGKRRDLVGTGYGGAGYKTTTENFLGAFLGELTIDFLRSNNKSVFSIFFAGGYIYSNAPAKTYTFQGAPSSHSENDWRYVQVGLRFGGRW